MNKLADRAANTTPTCPRAIGVDGWCHGRGARALRAAADCVGWRGSDRDAISASRVARLQKPNSDVLVWAKVASGALKLAVGSARRVNPVQHAMFGASRTSCDSRTHPVV